MERAFRQLSCRVNNTVVESCADVQPCEHQTVLYLIRNLGIGPPLNADWNNYYVGSSPTYPTDFQSAAAHLMNQSDDCRLAIFCLNPDAAIFCLILINYLKVHLSCLQQMPSTKKLVPCQNSSSHCLKLTRENPGHVYKVCITLTGSLMAQYSTGYWGMDSACIPAVSINRGLKP
jgi:hypothetical protein